MRCLVSVTASLGKAAILIATIIRLSAVSHAAESPLFQVTVDNLVTVDSVTSSDLGGARAHLNFPYVKQRANGDLIVNYTLGQTQSGMQSGRQSVSLDGGQTWSRRAVQVSGDGVQANLIRPAGQFSRGFSVSAQNAAGFTTFSNSRYNSSDGGLTWDSGAEDALYSTGGVSYSFLYGNFSDVVESNGSLYMSLYGTRLGSTRDESVLFVSDDDGKHWTRRSTIAAYTNSLDLGQMGTEGPSETAMMGLNNGDLLSVFRTGQPFPSSTIDSIAPSLFWSISHDNGLSWTAAKSLGVGGVFPLMRKLDNGSVALTFGRYGAKVMFADPSGTRWTTPTTIYNGPGSGQPEMRRRADGRYAYVYDQSGFYPPSWDASVPAAYVYDSDQSANLKAATLSFQQLPQNDSYAWALEYHGDAPPTAVGQGWVVSQNGSATTRLFAELGQDYLSSSTGLSGSNNSVSYSIGGAPGTAWAGIDFSHGAIFELRARAGSSSTTEGSASIFLGDGSHGAITLELDADSVNLEGLGGAAGQVEYSSTIHPEFSSRAWHDYRLLIEPQSAAGGAILAQLFLDGDSTHAILSQQLSSGGPDEIRFGDLAGTNNGIFEVDYLRFASLPTGVAGDYNNDGVVDAADYTVWRDNFGSYHTLPNDSTPGLVTAADYELWKNNFGMAAGGGAGTGAAVPEPAGAVNAFLALIGMVVGMVCSRGRCVFTVLRRQPNKIPNHALSCLRLRSPVDSEGLS